MAALQPRPEGDPSGLSRLTTRGGSSKVVARGRRERKATGLSHLVAVARDAFGEAPLLRGASPHAVEELSASAREVRLEAREWLFREGDAADQLFVVLSGRLQVVAADDGRLLREVGPGAALGELGLLTGSERSASVRAVRDSRLLAIDAENFVRLLEIDGGSRSPLRASSPASCRRAAGWHCPRRGRPYSRSSPPARALRRVFAAELRSRSTASAASSRSTGSRLAADDFAATLERAEAEFAHVLLLDGEGAWGGFCRRQSDRLLVVAAGDAPPEGGYALAGCDLVLEASPGAASRAGSMRCPPARAPHPSRRRNRARRERRGSRRRITQRSLGLVLSGGGARGFAHIGALAALAEAGFEFDRIGGCSMGSFIAAMGAIGRSAEEIEARARRSSSAARRSTTTRSRGSR